MVTSIAQTMQDVAIKAFGEYCYEKYKICAFRFVYPIGYPTYHGHEYTRDSDNKIYRDRGFGISYAEAVNEWNRITATWQDAELHRMWVEINPPCCGDIGIGNIKTMAKPKKRDEDEKELKDLEF